MSLKIESRTANEFLGRLEVTCSFPAGAGGLTRTEAAKAIASALKVSADRVFLMKLEPSFGSRSLLATVYVYSRPEDAKRQLPPHVFVRMLPPEERKKKMEEAKKKKAEAKALERRKA